MKPRPSHIVSVFAALTLLLTTAPAPQSPNALNNKATEVGAISNPSFPSAVPPAHPLTPALATSASAGAGVRSESAASTSPAAAQARVQQAFGELPLYFVENQGQLDERVAYYIQGSDKTIYFAPDGVTFALTARPQITDRRPLDAMSDEWEARSVIRNPQSAIQHWAVKLDFVGANPNVRPIGQDKTEAVISYFKGPQDQWHAGLPTYSRIVYHDVWPGIDLEYYGTVNQLKYEFIVQPGADPAQIRLAYRGADVSLNAEGQLLVTTPMGGFSDDTPVAYQDIDGQRVPVQVEYALNPLDHEPRETARNTRNEVPPFAPFESFREFAFQIAPYDPTRPLILDPAVLVYCGYIGGNSDDYSSDIAVDGAGNVYVIGGTASTEASFPVTGGPDLTFNGYYDVFVAKVNAAGTGLVYAGYIGGNSNDESSGIAVDGAGNAYVTGSTYSTQATFPVTGGPDLTFNGYYDVFVAKVNAAGTGLVYAGYLGGNSNDYSSGIAVDGTGNAYVTGVTASTEASFPVTVGPDLTFNGGICGSPPYTYTCSDAFVAKVNATGSGLVYAGYIGGNGDDDGGDIAVDGAGNAYVAGQTYSTEASFPVMGGPDLTYNGGTYGEAFVAKVNTTGSGLVYAGYIGGNGGDHGSSITVDGAGNAYVTGETDSTEASFPVAGGPDLTHNGGADAFVAKVNAAGTGLVYAGYIGGLSTDDGHGIAVDGAGNAYIAGRTDSTEASFPVAGGPDLTHNGGADAFVAKVNATGTGLVYAGYIGGNDADNGLGIAVDGAGNAYVTGWTTSNEASFPVTSGPDLTFNGTYDAFVAKVRGPVPGIITAAGHHLERDSVPFKARGMNYYPKDYAWDRFWISYTLALTQTNEELGRAKALGVNTVRVFVPYNLFDGTSQSALYLGYLTDFVGRLQARDMVALVTLFDFYPTYSIQPYSTTDYITSTRHISSVLSTLGVTNTAVLAWDIKNELDRDYAAYGKSQVQAWAAEMISYTRRLDVDHLVTLGFYGVVTGTPCYTSTPGPVYSPTIAAEFAPLVDVVSMHYFLPERCFESDLSALQAQVGEKPILLEEFGLHTQASAPGSPHTETEQAAYYNTLLSLSEAYGVAGYAFWTLNDFSYTLPGMPDSEKCMGILRNSLVNTCQVTTTQDYTAKPAAETIRRHYAEHVAYLDLFDSWVDPNTDLPPAGWSDNWQEGGALLRGYKPSNRLWSHDLGRVALSKFVTGSTSITGTALSPALVNVHADRYSILAGQVFSYSIRDSGRDSILYVGVKEGLQITPLLTIMPTTTLPYTFAVDLRQSPLNWSGNHDFRIALQLVPQIPNNGYSASYELDWIGLLAAPKASFAAWPTVGIAPMTVAFTNTSIGDSLQSQWNFGDDVTSTLDSPTHTYMTCGGYTITLAVNGLGSIDTLTRTNYITAYTPSHADFMASPTLGVTPMTVVFTNTSTGDYSTSLWNFGDNLTSTLPSPTHTYTTQGAYTVTLTVSGPGGMDTLTRTNYITAYEPVQASFVAQPVSGLVPLTIVFTNTSTGDYTESLWDLGDGAISTLQNPTHTYTATGVYTVGLTVIKRLGTLVLPGHISTLTRTNYIIVYAPVRAGFTASPISGVAPLTVTFTNTSTGSYTTSLWDFGDALTSTLTHPTHAYTTAGVYTVTLTASGPGGTDWQTRANYITVAEPPPVAGFTAAPTSGIRPLAVIFTDTSTGAVSTWLWNFGDDVTSTEQHPTHTYTVTGVYTVTLTVSGLGGSDTESKTSFITVRYGVYLPIILREYAPLFETALSLDGVDDYASALDGASLDLGTGDNDDFTIETFFYVPDLTNTGTDTLVWKPGAYGLYILYDASMPDRLIFRIWLDPTNYAYLHYDVNLSVGWHHVAAIFDNENTTSQDLVALYLDGSLVASSTQADWTPGIPDSTSALNIGAYLGAIPAVGWIEEMRFSDIVRYSSISYTVPTASFANDAGTRALWHFNEAPGSTVFADDSGNGNTLTGQNGAHTGSP